MKTRTVFAAAAAMATVLAAPAGAGQCGYQYCWGAVGFGPYGAAGWAHSYASQAGAYNRVFQECGGNCTQIKTFYNSCGAIAAGANNGWGWGTAQSRAQAQNIAMGYCNQYDVGCSVRAWACSF
ncbi:DUF4189 domain-containing protein [Roseovarius salis]|uniref:DUF4189 domain-containing protein n=1 Tax=Roseovarius salis TaxID=3376063 RepID=UPI0037C969EC